MVARQIYFSTEARQARARHTVRPNSEPDEYANFSRRVGLGEEDAAEHLVRRDEPEVRLKIRTRLRMRDRRLRRVFDSVDVGQSVLASFFVRAAVGEFDLEDPKQLIRLLV